MQENLEKIIAQINHFSPRPDLELITGDITDNGTLAQANNAARILAKLTIPYFVVPGNHDNPETLWTAFGQTNIPAKSAVFQNYTIEGHPLRLIGMDSSKRDGPGGRLCAEQLGWLKQRLGEQPQKPTLIFMHHPPVKCGVLETDEDGFEGAGELAEIIAAHTNIERIICGHIHLPTHTRWHNTIVSTSPGNGMQLALDLTMRKDSAFHLDAPAFQLHHWTAQCNLVTHTIYHRDNPGPYPFEEQ